jgi:hypothetical protein
VNFGRDMKGHVPRSQLQTVVGTTSQIFSRPDGAEARRRLGVVVVTLERSAPKGAVRLEAVPDDSRRSWPPRLISRRSCVRPTPLSASTGRSTGALRLAQNEWQVGRHLSVELLTRLCETGEAESDARCLVAATTTRKEMPLTPA